MTQFNSKWRKLRNQAFVQFYASYYGKIQQMQDEHDIASGQEEKSVIQDHLAPICCLSLKAGEVATELLIVCYVWTGPFYQKDGILS